MADNQPDSQVTHGMKGHVVGKATGPGRGDLGAPFDIHEPIPHNIVESDSEGGFKVTKLNASALKRLQKKNVSATGLSTDKTIDYYAAASQADAAPMPEVQLPPTRPVTHLEATVGPPGPPGSPGVPIIGANAAVDWPKDLPNPYADRAVQPRIPVKFVGEFGALTVPYDQVFIDNFCLVMIQNALNSGLYLAPAGQADKKIRVEFAGKAYLCLPGVQYTMPGGVICHTVYFIAEEILDEGANGNEKGQ